MSWLNVDLPRDLLSPLSSDPLKVPLRDVPLIPLALSLPLVFIILRGLPLSGALKRRLRKGNKKWWKLKRQDDLQRLVSQQEKILNDLATASSLDSEERRFQHLEFLRQTEEKFTTEETLRAQQMSIDITTLLEAGPFFRNMEAEEHFFHEGHELRWQDFNQDYSQWEAQLQDASQNRHSHLAQEEEELHVQVEEFEQTLGEKVASAINLMQGFFEPDRTEDHIFLGEEGEEEGRIAGPDRGEDMSPRARPYRVEIPVYPTSVLNGGGSESTDSRANTSIDSNSVHSEYYSASVEASVYSELPASPLPQDNSGASVDDHASVPAQTQDRDNHPSTTSEAAHHQPPSVPQDTEGPQIMTFFEARDFWNDHFRGVLESAQEAEDLRNRLFNDMYAHRERQFKVNRREEYRTMMDTLLPESEERVREFEYAMQEQERQFERLLRHDSDGSSTSVRVTPWDRMNEQMAARDIGSLGSRYRALFTKALSRHALDFEEYLRGIGGGMQETNRGSSGERWGLMRTLWRMFSGIKKRGSDASKGRAYSTMSRPVSTVPALGSPAPSDVADGGHDGSHDGGHEDHHVDAVSVDGEDPEGRDGQDRDRLQEDSDNRAQADEDHRKTDMQAQDPGHDASSDVDPWQYPLDHAGFQDYARILTSHPGRALIDVFLILRWGLVEILCVFLAVLHELWDLVGYMGALNRRARILDEDARAWRRELGTQRRAFERARSGREGVIREKGVEEYGEFLRKRGYVPGREDEIMREICEEAREGKRRRLNSHLGRRERDRREAREERERQFEEWKRFVSGEIDELCLEAGREFEQDEQERRMRIVEKRAYLSGRG
ncbi:hypothetical protein C0995_010880 [Termitomyces sp. Mi166|nr:hypothetical protein C0995_010880 [Termitomyces sp. Mi166\